MDCCDTVLFIHSNASPDLRRPLTGASPKRAVFYRQHYCLANLGEEYLVYFPEGGTATLDLRGTEGEYEVEWFIPTLNRTMKGPEPLKSGDFQVVEAPFASGDSLLYLKRK